MDRFYTDTQLIRYYYQETDLFETLELEHAMDEDIDLRFEFKMLKDFLDQLSPSSLQPSKNSVNAILAHAKMVH